MRPTRPITTSAFAMALACLAGLQAVSAGQGRQGATTARVPARPPAPARIEKRVPFQPGETLTYDVSWSNYLVAGTLTLTVREKRPSYGSVAYYIVAEARPGTLVSKLYTLYYKLDVLLDAYTLLPQRASTYSEEGQRRQMKVTRFSEDARKAEYEIQTGNQPKQELILPANTQDALSAVYVLRSIALGGRMTMPVNSGGHTYKVDIVTEAKESVKTAAGTFSAWRVRPQITGQDGAPDGRALRLWVADNPSRLPVKFQADLPVGSFNLNLREAR